MHQAFSHHLIPVASVKSRMFDKTPRLTTIMAALCFGPGFVSQAKADIMINTPPGLVAGDTFRIVFVTEAETMATSPNINDYNTFVNNDAKAEAGGGVVEYNGTPLTFKAIASTSATNAIDNMGVTNSPVYLFNGVKVANTDSLADLWSGTILAQIDRSLVKVQADEFVWTGTDPSGDGDVAFGVLGSGFEEESTLGFVGAIANPVLNGNWVEQHSDINDEAFPMYGISQVLTVTPEPSSIVLLSTGVVIGLAGYRWRRSKQAALQERHQIAMNSSRFGPNDQNRLGD
jgi:hypothetical protein